MRNLGSHHRRYLLASLLTLGWLVWSADRAAAQAYTLSRQISSMRTEVRTLIPGRVDVIDADEAEGEVALGDFRRSLSASASDGDGTAFVSVRGSNTQELRYGPNSITGLFRIEADAEESGGRSRPDIGQGFAAYFTVPNTHDLSYVLSGRAQAVFAPSAPDEAFIDVGFAIVDEDTPDPPNQGGTVIFGFSPEEAYDAFDLPFAGSGVLLAGHRYRIGGGAAFDAGVTANPLPPGTIERSIDVELGFTFTIIPEPTTLIPLCCIAFLARRRRCVQRR